VSYTIFLLDCCATVNTFTSCLNVCKLAIGVFSSIFNYKTFMLLAFHARASKKATRKHDVQAHTCTHAHNAQVQHVDIERKIRVTCKRTEWSYLSEYLHKTIWEKSKWKKRLRQFERTILSHYMPMLVQKPTTYSFNDHHLAYGP
jgi:hypothetical protein